MNSSNPRAPRVDIGPAAFVAPDVDSRPAARGDADRVIRVHWHAEPANGRLSASALISVRRLDDGTPVIEVYRASPGVTTRHLDLDLDTAGPLDATKDGE